uniref:Uncharacterized protein n=1 Tax=Avena sativa TaxID=4498 RepID=A0ACD5ZTN0_AVESA
MRNPPPAPPMATPPAQSPSPVRLRLVFDNRRLLRRSQREDGLRRCWLLVGPELATVADLSAHVAARFHLRRSCPGGIVLTMDGFSLPPFESTCIFRDKDIIRVKQKTCKSIVHHNDVHGIEDPEIVEKRPLPTDDKILAIEYQIDRSKHQEEVHCHHQPEDNSTSNHNLENGHTSSKRKWRDGDARIPESSKGKKLKMAKDTACDKVDTICQDRGRRGSKESKQSTIDIEAKKAAIQAEFSVELDGKEKAGRCNQTELICETEVAGQTTQSPKTSRSARRKKIKRQLRKKAKEQLKECGDCQKSPTAADFPSSSNQDDLPCPSSNENGLQLPFSRHEAEEEESDTSDDVVPVVVRPGHIRFEPAGELNTSLADETQATFAWSGTMSKKKGQKWGMNNSNKRMADIGKLGKIVGSNTEVNHLMINNKDEGNGFCHVSNQNVNESNHEEGKSSSEPLDFDGLYPLTRLPEEGDLIVYRLVELSSSWCPEISPYRVGKVLVYDLISMRIILLPVPEYPIITKEMTSEDKLDTPVDISPYKEDGSLEIEYSSLIDVRLLKGSEPVSAAPSTPIREAGKKGEPTVGEPVTLEKNKDIAHSQIGILVPNNTKDPEEAPEKKDNKVWEESSEIPKPDEVQENGWGTWKPNGSTSAWSYRAQRSSALGPTLALLRGKDGKGGKPKPPSRKYAR